MSTERWLVVIPCYNEAKQLPLLCDTLNRQSDDASIHLVIVDDGSQDHSGEVARELAWPWPILVVHRANSGGLAGGSAFRAWDFGVKAGIAKWGDHDWYMKLDADVRLAPDYFSIMRTHNHGASIVGGVLDDIANREQKMHVQGAVKSYSASAFTRIDGLPRALGFDVMDEVLVRAEGGSVRVVPTARWRVGRDTGSSEGWLYGRYRNGIMCRWTGYDRTYFLFHVLRYTFRRPYLIGAVRLVQGYLAAGPGPYPAHLKRRHTFEQRMKLRRLAKHPLRFLTETYGVR